MKELLAELLLRLAKVLAAIVVGLVIYLVLVGPLGVPGSPELAIEAFIAGGLVVLLMESSPI
jgi:multisubunit Na+/H+ antiporter MnhB subunit